jgi:hypothetical protein
MLILHRLCLGLVLLGFVVGPAYFGYALWFSGDVVKQSTVYEANYRLGAMFPEVTWQAVDTMRVFLSPSMNPLLLVAVHDRVSRSEDAPRRSTTFQVSLVREAAQLWEYPIVVSNKEAGLTFMPKYVTRFEVAELGDYEVVVRPDSSPGIPVRRLSLELRQHILVPDKEQLLAGTVLLAVGILGMAGVRRSQRAATGRAGSAR